MSLRRRCAAGRRLNSEVDRFRVVFADLDNGLPRFSRELEPSLVVQTSDAGGERFQAQWFIADPAGEQLTEEQWRGVMRCLVKDWGADPNAAKPAQGLRLAGTLNLKPGRGRFRVRIVHEFGRTFTASQMLEMLPPLPEPEPEYAAKQYAAGEEHAKLSSSMEKRQRRYFETGFAAHLARLSAMGRGSGRNDATYRSACRWGRYAHHGIASRQELVDGYLNACRANGLLMEDGDKACRATINGGISKAVNDRLEDLPNRGHTRFKKSAGRGGGPSSDNVDNDSAPDWPERTEKGSPRSRSQANIREFIAWRGVQFQFNAFTMRASATLDGETVPLSDEIMRGLRLEADALGLSPSKDFFEDVCLDLAQRNSFHPPREYLVGLVWDKTERLGKWLTTYLGVEDCALHGAFGRIHLIAAVRRLRKPGTKHDACLVFESKEQGVGKSTAIRTLAGDEWFTDALSIGEDPKGVIEQTSGAWLVEIAELSGIRRSEVEQVKAMISRQVDRARLAYGRFASDRARQFVLFGTVNESQYLRNSTGNRRFWPVRVGRIDLKALTRDRDQIWAEAAFHETRGEAIELPERLWAEAAKAQESRVIGDPWKEILGPVLEGKRGCILAKQLWAKLGIQPDRQDGNAGQRLTRVMNELGFKKARRRGHPEDGFAWCWTNSEETEWLYI